MNILSTQKERRAGGKDKGSKEGRKRKEGGKMILGICTGRTGRALEGDLGI